MPRNTKVKKVRSTKAITAVPSFSKADSLIQTGETQKRGFLTKKNLIILALLLAIVLAWKFKGNFIAATVNGQPIPRFELTDELNRRFGGQILDGIINERLILSATRQKGVFVTTQEIDGRIKQIESRLQGKVTLKEALTAQGLTETSFRRQLEIQLAIEKLFDKEATVSTQDVDDYLTKNASVYKSATNPAEVKSEVEAILKQQKTTDLFDTWFTDIKKNAQINKFL